MAPVLNSLVTFVPGSVCCGSALCLFNLFLYTVIGLNVRYHFSSKKCPQSQIFMNLGSQMAKIRVDNRKHLEINILKNGFVHAREINNRLRANFPWTDVLKCPEENVERQRDCQESCLIFFSNSIWDRPRSPPGGGFWTVSCHMTSVRSKSDRRL